MKQVVSKQRERDDIKEVHESCDAYKQIQQKMYAITRNTTKCIKRRERTIEERKQEIACQQKVNSYKKQIDRIDCRLSNLKAEFSRVNHRAAYWKSKAKDLKGGKAAKVSELCAEIKRLKQAMSSLELDNVEMGETIEELLFSDEIVTFEGGKYTDDIRACIYELLSLNVGVRNIGPTINCVLKNLAASRLPSYGLTCQMILESLIIVQAQLGDKLKNTESYGTLQTDGTTKFGEHYATYDVRINESENPYALGIRHIFSRSAKNTLETFTEILDDIDSVQLALGKECASSKIIVKIKNTMSDRHSAEKLFNELLEE